MIHRRGDVPVSGRIVQAEPDHVVVGIKDGTRQSIQRSEVAVIDHPGNVVAVTGLCLLTMAAWIAGASGSQAEGLWTFGIFGTPALAMTVWGTSVFLRSKHAAANVESEMKRVSLPDPSRPYQPAPTWSGAP